MSPDTLSTLTNLFYQNFSEHGDIGASLSVWKQGDSLLELAHGTCERGGSRSWTESTLIPVYSATKGPASATLLWALAENGLTPKAAVQRVWPAFPAKGATFAQLLSHQCGLPAIDQTADVADYPAVIAALEKTTPAWPLGTGHGYHPRTFGFLLDECVRRITGSSLGSLWNDHIRASLDLDFWIGLPPEHHSRVATLSPGKMQKSDTEEGFYKAFTTPDSLTRRAFSSPTGLQGVSEMNRPEAWQLALPAMGGVGTAQSLAQFYQAILSGSFFGNDILQWLTRPLTSGDDQVLIRPTAFAAGFMQDPLDSSGAKLRHLFGPNTQAFGHPGAGGSHAFADPVTGISFAYTMNQMELGVLPGRKSLNLVQALYA